MIYDQAYFTRSSRSFYQDYPEYGVVAASDTSRSFIRGIGSVTKSFETEPENNPVAVFIYYSDYFKSFVQTGIRWARPVSSKDGNRPNMLAHVYVPKERAGMLDVLRDHLDFIPSVDKNVHDDPLDEAEPKSSVDYSLDDVLVKNGLNKKGELEPVLSELYRKVLKGGKGINIVLPDEKGCVDQVEAMKLAWLLASLLPEPSEDPEMFRKRLMVGINTVGNGNDVPLLFSTVGRKDHVVIVPGNEYDIKEACEGFFGMLEDIVQGKKGNESLREARNFVREVFTKDPPDVLDLRHLGLAFLRWKFSHTPYIKEEDIAVELGRVKNESVTSEWKRQFILDYISKQEAVSIRVIKEAWVEIIYPVLSEVRSDKLLENDYGKRYITAAADCLKVALKNGEKRLFETIALQMPSDIVKEAVLEALPLALVSNNYLSMIQSFDDLKNAYDTFALLINEKEFLNEVRSFPDRVNEDEQSPAGGGLTTGLSEEKGKKISINAELSHAADDLFDRSDSAGKKKIEGLLDSRFSEEKWTDRKYREIDTIEDSESLQSCLEKSRGSMTPIFIKKAYAKLIELFKKEGSETANIKNCHAILYQEAPEARADIRQFEEQYAQIQRDYHDVTIINEIKGKNLADVIVIDKVISKESERVKNVRLNRIIELVSEPSAADYLPLSLDPNDSDQYITLLLISLNNTVSMILNEGISVDKRASRLKNYQTGLLKLTREGAPDTGLSEGSPVIERPSGTNTGKEDRTRRSFDSFRRRLYWQAYSLELLDSKILIPFRRSKNEAEKKVYEAVLSLYQENNSWNDVGEDYRDIFNEYKGEFERNNQLEIKLLDRNYAPPAAWTNACAFVLWRKIERGEAITSQEARDYYIAPQKARETYSNAAKQPYIVTWKDLKDDCVSKYLKCGEEQRRNIRANYITLLLVSCAGSLSSKGGETSPQMVLTANRIHEIYDNAGSEERKVLDDIINDKSQLYTSSLILSVIKVPSRVCVDNLRAVKKLWDCNKRVKECLALFDRQDKENSIEASREVIKNARKAAISVLEDRGCRVYEKSEDYTMLSYNTNRLMYEENKILNGKEEALSALGKEIKNQPKDLQRDIERLNPPTSSDSARIGEGVYNQQDVKADHGKEILFEEETPVSSGGKQLTEERTRRGIPELNLNEWEEMKKKMENALLNEEV